MKKLRFNLNSYELSPTALGGIDENNANRYLIKLFLFILKLVNIF